MSAKAFLLGVDLGTTGVRIAVINTEKDLLYFSSMEYEKGLENPEEWKICCISLIRKIPSSIKKNMHSKIIDTNKYKSVFL